MKTLTPELLQRTIFIIAKAAHPGVPWETVQELLAELQALQEDTNDSRGHA